MYDEAEGYKDNNVLWQEAVVTHPVLGTSNKCFQKGCPNINRVSVFISGSDNQTLGLSVGKFMQIKMTC